MPPTVFLVVRRMTKLAMTIRTSEARQVGMDQHMIVEAVLTSKDGTTPSALVRLNPLKINSIYLSTWLEGRIFKAAIPA